MFRYCWHYEGTFLQIVGATKSQKVLNGGFDQDCGLS